LDRVNISIAASSIKTEYALSNIQLGWVFSAFVLGYALFQAPGGRVADKFGPRVVIALAILWWSVFTLFTAIVPVAMAGAVALLIAVRFSLGIGEAVMFPASNRLVAKWIPSSERGLANGLIFAGVGAGSAVAPPLITWILLNWGWRWAFYVRVPIGILAALLWYWLVRDTPQVHPWTSKKEADTIQAGLPKPAAATAAQAKLSWGSILGNRSMAALTISYFAFGYVAWIRHGAPRDEHAPAAGDLLEANRNLVREHASPGKLLAVHHASLLAISASGCRDTTWPPTVRR
jgi:ACS family glucarate transporter-like MFS transporter